MASNRYRHVAFGLACCAALAAIGCCTNDRAARLGTDNSRNLLFSTNGSGLATRDVPRSDWPSTESFDDTSDKITFRERVTDVQGLSGRSQDYSFRRFSSVRTGARRR